MREQHEARAPRPGRGGGRRRGMFPGPAPLGARKGGNEESKASANWFRADLSFIASFASNLGTGIWQPRARRPAVLAMATDDRCTRRKIWLGGRGPIPVRLNPTDVHLVLLLAITLVHFGQAAGGSCHTSRHSSWGFRLKLFRRQEGGIKAESARQNCRSRSMHQEGTGADWKRRHEI